MQRSRDGVLDSKLLKRTHKYIFQLVFGYQRKNLCKNLLVISKF